MLKFDYEGTTYTIRTETIRDRLTIDALVYQLGESEDITERYMKRQFAEFTQLTTVNGVALNATHESPADLQAQYEEWLDMPSGLYEAWREARASEKKQS